MQRRARWRYACPDGMHYVLHAEMDCTPISSIQMPRLSSRLRNPSSIPSARSLCHPLAQGSLRPLRTLPSIRTPGWGEISSLAVRASSVSSVRAPSVSSVRAPSVSSCGRRAVHSCPCKFLLNGWRLNGQQSGSGPAIPQ